MKVMDVYCKKALEMGVDGAKMIDPRSIMTSEWVRMKCQFGCPGFRKRLCCPPYTPTPDVTRKVIDSYQEVILLHQRLRNDEKRVERRKVFNEIIVRLEIEIFIDGYYKAWGMGSGACRLCKECEPTGPCKHGFKARPSMGACGIDVFKTAKDNGFHIEIVKTNEEAINIFGLVLVE
jgi:predicted metal-binding protein